MYRSPTSTNSWKKLFSQAKARKLHTYSDLKLAVEEVSFDFSNQLMDQESLQTLLDFAKEMNIEQGIHDLLSKEELNVTEKRAVLHPALRQFSPDIDAFQKEVSVSLDKIKDIVEQVHSGKWLGHTGKRIKTLVNIGTGGSHLGPAMVVDALKLYRKDIEVHYISNLDVDHTLNLMESINPEETLFLIVSKSFGTTETVTSARLIMDHFFTGLHKDKVSQHFIASTTNIQAATDFGISSDHILPMWDGVGGRFSLWSSAGVSIALSLGYEVFEELLKGGHAMDMHLCDAPIEKNAPIIGALISIWYRNILSCQTEAVIAYSTFLEKLVPYLQQVSMESNGKSIDRNGHRVTYDTSGVIWGGVGTDVQHSFMQLIHQGTMLIPVDFIGIKKSLNDRMDIHTALLANYKAQIKALQIGRKKDEIDPSTPDYLRPYKTFQGQKPTNSILLETLSPRNLGILLAYYEHKTFILGLLWNINSFDQYGVELGKELAKEFMSKK